MDYLTPLETQKNTIKRFQQFTFVILILLGIAMLAVPAIIGRGPVVVIDTQDYMHVVKSKPWNVTISRIEGFTKLYLSSRFEWVKNNFSEKKEVLSKVTDETIFKRLKDSIGSFESIATNQNGKSYYVLEGYGFSNEKRKIEARITRVLRMNNLAVATPFTVRLSYKETSVSESNPYGLVVDGLEEVEPTTEQGGDK